MKNKLNCTLVMIAVVAVGCQAASAQFPIKIPKIKIEKPKTEQPKPETDRPVQSNSGEPTVSDGSRYSAAVRKPQYGFFEYEAKPMFLKDSIYIQASSRDEYWKMPGQKYSSWVPVTVFKVYYDWKVSLEFVAEYYHPDGSPWFTDTFVEGSQERSGLVPYVSATGDYGNKIRETKASIATGLYGIKITNKGTGEVVLQGKFKVGKFPREYKTKNEFEFYVDHDWIMPIGTVTFHYSNFIGQNLGANFPVQVNMWFKKNLGSDNGLEARLFYKGQQIATTNRIEGIGTRASEVGNFSAELHHWKLMRFEWFNEQVNVDNGSQYHRDNMPKSFFVDRNPGEYTVKVYQNGVQVREAVFAVGTDGRIVDGGYYKPGKLAFYTVIIPVKIIGAAEKWNAAAWKTEAFYGNPMVGFPLQ